MPWQEDASQKVGGSNPGADRRIFLVKIFVEVCLYDNTGLKYEHFISVSVSKI